MNLTKFFVLLLIEFVCAFVGPRQVEGVSKVANLGISTPKTSNGVGAQLSVIVKTIAAGLGNPPGTNAAATVGSGGPSSRADVGGSESSSGFISVVGPNAYGDSGSSASGEGNTNAAARPNDATASGNDNASGSSFVHGSIVP